MALLGARPADPSRHVALALALARARAGAAVLLLDLSPGAAESLIALDLEAGYGVGEALEDLDRLDHALLASAVPRHGGTGLALLALDEGRRLEALPPGDVAALLALLRGVYDEVVVHAPAAMPALVPALPGLVRRLGFVLTQNLASARACADALRAAREGGVTQADAALLVVAAHDARILPAPNTLAGTLGLAEAIPVAERHAALCNAVNQGRFEAVLAERGLGREMARIAAALGLPEAPGRAARRLSWPWPRRKGART